ncbi:MAG: LysM peptidoglycan-binding domain-containing protein [Saccharopolyspora sp.]|nr:LysM peptidoglycan-binding domain-containing protein [Saccharopolyspora sp. HNM0986]MBQ6644087.1 LysM peptidoglycan-binding domain-containing protein [Saccharopolyspora sp.]
MVLAFGLLAAEPAEPVPNATELVSVGSGDTLPGLAARFAPDSDQGAVIRRIVELNHLDAAEPATGRSLIVPVRRG